MVNKVLQKSKLMDEEKVGISFQMPKSLKKQIDKVCEDNDIKLTTFFNSLAQYAIDELQEKGDLIYLEGRRLASERVSHLKDYIESTNPDAEEYYRISSEIGRLTDIFDL